MGNALGAGGGVATGQLVAMWRSVYQKAADAAEGRLQALLGQHVAERHGRRALCVVFDGGGATVATGVKADVELPWAFRLEGWALYATASGALTVGLQQSAGLATFPADLASVTGTGVAPNLTGAQKARSEDLTGWTVSLPRGAILRATVDAASGITGATLTLFLRAV